MVTSKSGQLLELGAEIAELEEEIPDQRTRNLVLAVPKKLVAQAQDYYRKGDALEACLTINCASRLLEQAKRAFKR